MDARVVCRVLAALGALPAPLRVQGKGEELTATSAQLLPGGAPCLPILLALLSQGFLQWLQVSDVTSNLLLPSATSASAC